MLQFFILFVLTPVGFLVVFRSKRTLFEY